MELEGVDVYEFQAIKKDHHARDYRCQLPDPVRECEGCVSLVGDWIMDSWDEVVMMPKTVPVGFLHFFGEGFGAR